MLIVMYSDVDRLIDEGLITPTGEDFYFVACDEQHKTFRDAIVRYDSEKERYEIEGDQTIYTEHKGMGLDYEKFLCLHPQELIHKKSFFGFTWFNVCGVLKREIRSVYLGQHKEYRIHERSAVLSYSFEER